MRLLLLSLLTLLVLAVTATAQQSQTSFFTRLRNYLRPRRQNTFANRPPPPAQQTSFAPTRTNFGPPRNNFRNSPQQQFQSSSPGFNPAPAPATTQFASQPGPANVVLNNNQFSSGGSNRFRSPAQAPAPAPAPSQSFRTCDNSPSKAACPKAAPNHNWNGQDYLLTFNMDCGACACRNFTAQEADDYCKSMGARAVSLDTKQKWEHFRGVAIQFAERYFWTGGRMNYPDNSYTWPSGVTKRVQNSGDPWSHTGGWDKPQPDNRNQLRDNCEPELCIGVLNNFYADGVVWHDVACHHKKPTICEWPRGGGNRFNG